MKNVLFFVSLCVIAGCERQRTWTQPKVTDFVQCPTGAAAGMKHLGGDRYSIQIDDATHTGQFPSIQIEFEAGKRQHNVTTPFVSERPRSTAAFLKHLGGTSFSIHIQSDHRPSLFKPMVMHFDTHYPMPAVDETKLR